jgi:flavin-binding protein dodecin
MWKYLPVIALLFFTCRPCAAQVATAELTGTVLDSSGAAVGGAKVTATDVATNLVHATVSDTSGVYVLTLLPPGDYTVTVEAAGFRKLVQSGVALQINQEAKLDLTL